MYTTLQVYYYRIFYEDNTCNKNVALWSFEYIIIIFIVLTTINLEWLSIMLLYILFINSFYIF